MTDKKKPWIPDEDPSPDARVVTDFHRRSDVDQTAKSQHHTLGTSRYNAARGDHVHDGSTGVTLLDDLTLSGNVNDLSHIPALLSELFNALAVNLGANDNTTSSGNVIAFETGFSSSSWTTTDPFSNPTTVPLTVGKFSTAPFIFITRRAGNPNGGRACDYRINSVSTSSFTYNAMLGGGDTGIIGSTIYVMWLAIGTKTVS